MKKQFLSMAILAVTTASALSADLPSRKAEPVPPPPPPMWTGFYAGLNAGYSWGTNNAVTANFLNTGSWALSADDGRVGGQGPVVATPGVGTPRNSMTQSGFVGGGQFGYNYQFRDRFLIGFEADIQGASIRGNSSNYGVFSTTTAGPNFFTPSNTLAGAQVGSVSTSINAGLDYLGTARGRLGYLATPMLLV